MILATILGLSALGQTTLPGDGMGLDEARAKARLIVVARPAYGRLIIGSGPHFFGTLDLTHSAVLKGDPRGNDLKRVSFSASGQEAIPRQDEEYLFFINDFKDHPRIIKVLPKTPEKMKPGKAAGAEGNS